MRLSDIFDLLFDIFVIKSTSLLRKKIVPAIENFIRVFSRVYYYAMSPYQTFLSLILRTFSGFWKKAKGERGGWANSSLRRSLSVKVELEQEIRGGEAKVGQESGKGRTQRGQWWCNFVERASMNTMFPCYHYFHASSKLWLLSNGV